MHVQMLMLEERDSEGFSLIVEGRDLKGYGKAWLQKKRKMRVEDFTQRGLH